MHWRHNREHHCSFHHSCVHRRLRDGRIFVNEDRLDARINAIQFQIESGQKLADAYRGHALADATRLAADIEDMKHDQKTSREWQDARFSRLEAMITADRQQADMIEGGLVLAKWLGGALIGLSGAVVSGIIYWFSRKHT